MVNVPLVTAGWQAPDFTAIFDGHLALARAVARASEPLLIEDTDPLQTLVWAEYLLGEVPQALLDRMADYRLADLYLLLGAETEWRDDGTRYSGDRALREWFVGRLEYWLNKLGARWQAIDATGWAARQSQAETAIANLCTPPLAQGSRQR